MMLELTGVTAFCKKCHKRIYEYRIDKTETGWESENGSDFCGPSPSPEMHEPMPESIGVTR